MLLAWILGFSLLGSVGALFLAGSLLLFPDSILPTVLRKFSSSLSWRRSYSGTTQLRPARWAVIAVGAEWAFRDPTMLARLLHFVLGSVAVAGVLLALLAVEREHRAPDPFHHWLARRGIGLDRVATGLQAAA